jgi:hypothetical protein
MKKFLTVAAIGALIAVSGCGKSENASGPVKREAGNWKTDVKLVKFDVPGMPAGTITDEIVLKTDHPKASEVKIELDVVIEK